MVGSYPTFQQGINAAGLNKSNDNWMTDPNAPWNTWAQNLEGFLQDWVSTQREGLLADLQARTAQSAQQAIGQGLYTGTYTTSLPAEQLSKMTAQHTQNYAGAMSNLQAQALAQLMQGQQAHGSQMLMATLEDLARQAYADANSFNFFTDFWLPNMQAGAQVKMAAGCFAEDTAVATVGGDVPISEIKQGDLVVVGDEKKQVKKVFIYDENPTMRVNGIEVTHCHPFVMADGTLLLSGLLKVGDVLHGGRVVEEITPIKSDKRVCNLEVAGHRYTVGEMLVHDGRQMRG